MLTKLQKHHEQVEHKSNLEDVQWCPNQTIKECADCIYEPGLRYRLCQLPPPFPTKRNPSLESCHHGARTHDRKIKVLALYQLSYAGEQLSYLISEHTMTQF